MRLSKTLAPLAIAAAAATALTGCGGGGDGPISSTVAATYTAEGYWTGFTPAGWAFNLAVLETGETWALYFSGTTIFGAMAGKSTWTTTALSGSGTEFIFPTRSVVPSTHTGTYTRKANMLFQTSGGASANTSYATLYDAPVNLSQVAGVFRGPTVTAKSNLLEQTLTVDTNGAINGGNVGCGITGVMLPRPSAKGVFNLFVTLAGQLCPLGIEGPMQGLAVYDPADRRLVMISVNSEKKDGFFYVGTR
jgi:hypothetical protein